MRRGRWCPAVRGRVEEWKWSGEVMYLAGLRLHDVHGPPSGGGGGRAGQRHPAQCRVAAIGASFYQVPRNLLSTQANGCPPSSASFRPLLSLT